MHCRIHGLLLYRSPSYPTASLSLFPRGGTRLQHTGHIIYYPVDSHVHQLLIVAFLQIMVTFSNYISNAYHSLSGVTLRLQNTGHIIYHVEVTCSRQHSVNAARSLSCEVSFCESDRIVETPDYLSRTPCFHRGQDLNLGCSRTRGGGGGAAYLHHLSLRRLGPGGLLHSGVVLLHEQAVRVGRPRPRRRAVCLVAPQRHQPRPAHAAHLCSVTASGIGTATVRCIVCCDLAAGLRNKTHAVKAAVSGIQMVGVSAYLQQNHTSAPRQGIGAAAVLGPWLCKIDKQHVHV